MRRGNLVLRVFTAYAAVLLAMIPPVSANAQESAPGIKQLETVEVTAAATSNADSASSGDVSRDELAARPLLRPGAMLESVPGLVVTQHSGEGKANQYFLRAFNLDHGTDLATRVDGMPVNMPTHGHGQGYTDLNFLIPELVQDIRYKKGPYFADEGDFSAAGAVNIRLLDELSPRVAEVGVGEDGYRRALVLGSARMGDGAQTLLGDGAGARDGKLLYGLEAYHNDGPYTHPDDYRKYNGVLRYTRGDETNRLSLTAMGYGGRWNSTDQVPQRAIDNGLISRFDALDPSDGGEADRESLSGSWSRLGHAGESHASAYVIHSKLDLFSNFTYFLDDPVSGDQFTQHDERIVAGLDAAHTWYGHLGAYDTVHTLGLQSRHDDIDVALRHTREREVLSSLGDDRVRETSAALYYENATQWHPKFRSVLGLREDLFHFDVTDRLDPRNSGAKTAAIASPKASLIFGPWARTAYFMNFGYSYHSNDARGITKVEDSVTHEPLSPATPLVRAKGAEIGLRSSPLPGLDTELDAFVLDIQSELVFSGDAGTTEPSGATRRTGVEWASVYRPTSWLMLDANLALSRGRFKEDVGDPPHVGRFIPGAPTRVITAGATVNHPQGYLATLRLRHFGPRPLIEDDSVESKTFTVVDARVGYQWKRRWRLALDVFNVFDVRWNDIEYFYTSRLLGEPPEGIADRVIHPGEPRTLRVSLAYFF